MVRRLLRLTWLYRWVLLVFIVYWTIWFGFVFVPTLTEWMPT